MWSKLPKLWRRKAWREEDTREALEGPVPPGTEAFPFDTSLGARTTWVFLAHLIGLSLPSLFIAYFGYPDRLAFALFAAGVAVSLASGLYELQAGGRAIRVAEEGIRLRRLLSEAVLPWWAISAVVIDPKLSQVRVRTDTGVVHLRTAALSVEQRKLLVWAIRARGEQRGIPLSLDRSRRFAVNVGAVALNMAGYALIVAAVSLTPTYAGSALGIRCSAASQYLRTRFAAAEHRGCVVVRVSGAAEKAGIRQGDLMIEMDGTAVTSGAQFSALFNLSSKSHFTFTVLRPGATQPLHFDVHLGRAGKAPHTPETDPLFYFLRARSDAANGKIDRPIADYTKAIELDTAFDLAYVYRAELHTELRRDLPAAENDITMALQLSPDLGEVHRFASYVYRDEGRRTEARQQLQRAIELDQCDQGFTGYNIDCAEDYYALASVTGPDLQAVAAAAERSIEFYAGFANTYYTAAWAYHDLGQLDKARDRAQAYLDFPKSERVPQKDWYMRLLLAPSGATMPPPPELPNYPFPTPASAQ